jgi:hypothetical protein
MMDSVLYFSLMHGLWISFNLQMTLSYLTNWSQMQILYTGE